MGLFDFKNNKEISTQIKLDLESLLMKAATEPAYRAELYKRLLSDNLIIITQDSKMTEGKQILEKDTQVKIISYPDGKIPVFTSTQRIFDKGIVTEQVNYLEMKGENLFELTKGATFLLNPYSDYGKELLPDEIDSMLKGTILTDKAKTITIQKDTNVQIGQPVNYPKEIISSLNELFSNKQNVKAAYLGWIYSPDSGEPPHYIFGLDASGDYNSLVQEAGFIAKQYLGSDDFVDFIKMDNNTGVVKYLKSTLPFYEKK